ncbi:MAG TPA: hypothetical protein PKL52_09550 [Tenuifilaceae bacterium]|nr:hypothetical protein [Tenuifilaceae bacterium]
MYRVFAVLLFPFLLASWGDGTLSPREFFGDSYHEAVSFLRSQTDAFNHLTQRYDVDKRMAMAIIFPELIRYNRFRDFAETTVLELTYVDDGPLAADFSIGRFQMKPSFVEQLETIVMENEALSNFSHIVQYSTPDNVKSVRTERLKRLKQHQWQMEYLACFMTIGQNRFSAIIDSNPHEELLILSSLYNLSLNATYQQLQQTAQSKTFPYGRLSMANFSYYDVANYFYIHHAISLM